MCYGVVLVPKRKTTISSTANNQRTKVINDRIRFQKVIGRWIIEVSNLLVLDQSFEYDIHFTSKNLTGNKRKPVNSIISENKSQVTSRCREVSGRQKHPTWKFASFQHPQELLPQCSEWAVLPELFLANCEKRTVDSHQTKPKENDMKFHS